MDIRLRFKTSYMLGLYTTEFKLPLLRSMHDFEFRNDFEMICRVQWALLAMLEV